MYFEEILKTKKMRELVEIYNGLEGTNPVKRFGSLKDGVARIIKFQNYSVKKKSRTQSERGVRVSNILEAYKDLNNREFSKVSTFVKLCASINIEATVRQASKFRNYRGIVFMSL